MENRFFLILASILLYACGNDTGSTYSDIPGMDRVEIKERQKISMDSVIAKIDYIKLGDTGDVLIGKVTHLLFTPDHIVVGDADKAQAVFIFDRQGNPQTVINRFGRGPQEYQSIRYVFLTPDKKTVGIVDRGGQKILYFDMDGNFKDKKSLPFYCDNAEWLDDETMILVSDGVHINAVLYGYDPSDQKQCVPQSFRPDYISLSAFARKTIRRPHPCVQVFRRHDLPGDKRRYLSPLLARYDSNRRNCQFRERHVE